MNRPHFRRRPRPFGTRDGLPRHTLDGLPRHAHECPLCDENRKERRSYPDPLASPVNPEPIVISDRVVILCPECGEQIPVSIVVTVEGEPGEQTLLADPDMADLWAHAWTHAPGATS